MIKDYKAMVCIMLNGMEGYLRIDILCTDTP